MTIPAVGSAGPAYAQDVNDVLAGLPIDLGDQGGDNGGVVDNFAAWLSARTLLRAAGGGKLHIGPGAWYFSATVRLDRNIIIEGDGGWQSATGVSVGPATQLYFPDGVPMIQVERAATSEDGGAGDGSTIADLGLFGLAHAVSTAHAIDMRARANVRNVYIEGAGGIGVNIDTNASGTNADNFRLDTMRIYNCLKGVFCDGPNSNAGVGINVSAVNSRAEGIFDSSFLGNTWIACHTSGNVGAPYKADSNTSAAMFIGCYSESGQPPSDITSPAVVLGGTHGAGFTTNNGGYLKGSADGVEWRGGTTTTNVLGVGNQSDLRVRFRVRGDGKVTWGDGANATLDTNLYRDAANSLKTDSQFGADKGIRTLIKAGVPADGDFPNPASGLIAVDTTDSRLYVRVGSTWKYAALT